MSLSTQPFKGFFSDGWHLVAIIEATVPPTEPNGSILITFADGNNNKRQELFKMDKHFIKMCGDAGLITEESVFDSKKAIGARLMIEIVEGMFADTKEYILLQNQSPQITFKQTDELGSKSRIIAEQRAMIKKVESGESNEFDM